MHRFFLPPNLFSSPEIVFPDDVAHQARSVLRLRPGQQVTALDNQGSQFLLELVEVSPNAVLGRVIERSAAPGEPETRVSLYLGLTQREKFEWMLQKCTEVGAAEFIPLVTSRSLVQDAGDAVKKAARWQRILQEAAEQSGRGRIPVLHPAVRFAPALEAARRDHSLTLIPWEGETSLSMREAIEQAGQPAPRNLALFIGPEGGFSEEEISAARAAGVQPVTLGPRILRMETAAVVALSLALYQLGEMG